MTENDVNEWLQGWFATKGIMQFAKCFAKSIPSRRGERFTPEEIIELNEKNRLRTRMDVENDIYDTLYLFARTRPVLSRFMPQNAGTLTQRRNTKKIPDVPSSGKGNRDPFAFSAAEENDVTTRPNGYESRQWVDLSGISLQNVLIYFVMMLLLFQVAYVIYTNSGALKILPHDVIVQIQNQRIENGTYSLIQARQITNNVWSQFSNNMEKVFPVLSRYLATKGIDSEGIVDHRTLLQKAMDNDVMGYALTFLAMIQLIFPSIIESIPVYLVKKVVRPIDASGLKSMVVMVAGGFIIQEIIRTILIGRDMVRSIDCVGTAVYKAISIFAPLNTVNNLDPNDYSVTLGLVAGEFCYALKYATFDFNLGKCIDYCRINQDKLNANQASIGDRGHESLSRQNNLIDLACDIEKGKSFLSNILSPATVQLTETSFNKWNEEIQSMYKKDTVLSLGIIKFMTESSMYANHDILFCKNQTLGAQYYIMYKRANYVKRQEFYTYTKEASEIDALFRQDIVPYPDKVSKFFGKMSEFTLPDIDEQGIVMSLVSKIRNALGYGVKENETLRKEINPYVRSLIEILKGDTSTGNPIQSSSSQTGSSNQSTTITTSSWTTTSTTPITTAK